MNIERCAELFAAFSGGRVFVGFSGGADSCAALLVTHRFAERFGFALTAVHINHHLRGEESDREEKAAEAFAAGRGIAFQCFHLSGLTGGNLEARAREERLKIWQRLAAAPGCAVVLGHHRDDRIETLFLRLLRGSNVSGLAALRRSRTVGGVTILRPLLGFSRQEIEAFLKENGVTHFALDSSNSDEKYLRNFLRNDLLKTLVGKVPHALTDLSRSLDALTEDAEFLEQTAWEKYQVIRRETKTPLEFWRSLHPALQIRVLRLFASEKTAEEFIPDRALFCRFRREISASSAEKRLIPFRNGLFFAVQGEYVWVETEKEHPADVCWQWKTQKSVRWGRFSFERQIVEKMPEKTDDWSCCFDADAAPEIFFLTCRRNGDKLIPFGRQDAVSLKKLRTDRKLTADANYPVLRDDKEMIFWACGIRHCAVAPVTEKTRRVLLIKCR